MKLELLNTGKNSGNYNMNFDLNLVHNLKSGQGFFRLYYWEPYCISLGANQAQTEINEELCKKDGIEIVKRPTGGRAILHAEEITYSFVIAITDVFQPRIVYKLISEALIESLAKYNSILSECSLENNQPNFRNLLQTNSGIVCFASTAQNEVNFRGKKLIGSAQRKIDGKILQHGSILIGKRHKDLPKYLNISEEEKAKLFTEMGNKTTEIETILSEKINYSKLEEALLSTFSEKFNR